jgi:hypothetical protein
MAAEMIAVQQALGGASNLVNQNALVRIATSGALAEALNLVWDGTDLFVGPRISGTYENSIGIISLTSGTSTLRLRGRMGTNDYWQIRGSDTSSDNSFLEFVTGDNHNEPFRFKQVSGSGVAQVVSRFGEGPKGQFASIGRDAEPNSTLNIQDSRQGVIGPVTFSGTGLNDLTTGGEYYRTIQQTYCIQIDGVGTPDTFRWSEDNCTTFVASGVQITGSEQPLSWGVNVTFASTTGHTLNDRWTFVTEPAGETLLRITAGPGNYYSDGSTYYASPLLEISKGDQWLFRVLADSGTHVNQNGINVKDLNDKTRASASANFYTTNSSGFIVDSPSIFGWSDTDGITNDTNITQLMREGPGLISLARKSGNNTPARYFYFDGPNFRISFGGTTSSFPSLKRSGSVLQSRLADDSGFARFQAGSPTGLNDVLVYGSSSPPAAGCAQFDSSGRVVSTGVACGTGGGSVNAYANVTDGNTTASASGPDTLKFRSSDSSVLITVGSNDPTHGDNVNIRLPKTTDASTFESSTTWSRSGSDHGLGTSCDWTWAVYTVSGSTYTHTEGFNGYTCNTTTGDVTITWPVATAGRLVLIKSGGSGGGGDGDITAVGTCSSGDCFVDVPAGRVLASPAAESGPVSARQLVETDIPNLSASKITSGVFDLARGGTNNSSWIAGRCVQVSSDGTRLEPASSACGTGGGSFDPSDTYDLTGLNKVNVEYTSIYLQNHSTSGTALYRTVCVASDGRASQCTTVNAPRTIGVCLQGCGTTGNARIAVSGKMTCEFEGGVTAGNWATVSSSQAGKCVDAGTTKPAVPLGIILVTQSGAGNYDIIKGIQ